MTADELHRHRLDCWQRYLAAVAAYQRRDWPAVFAYLDYLVARHGAAFAEAQKPAIKRCASAWLLHDTGAGLEVVRQRDRALAGVDAAGVDAGIVGG